jgi:hypothetical protein
VVKQQPTNAQDGSWQAAFWIVHCVHKPRDMHRPVGGDDPVLGHVSPDRVDGLSALANEKTTGLECKPGGLFLNGFHRHESHGGSGRRFRDRLRIGRVIFISLYEGLHVDRRDQPHLVPETTYLPSPVMRACAGLHGDQTARYRSEE